MAKFHVVGISTRGYHYISGEDSLAAACPKVAEVIHRRHMGCVVRDGATGKRYSLVECQARLTALGQSPTMSMPGN